MQHHQQAQKSNTQQKSHHSKNLYKSPSSTGSHHLSQHSQENDLKRYQKKYEKVVKSLESEKQRTKQLQALVNEMQKKLEKQEKQLAKKQQIQDVLLSQIEQLKAQNKNKIQFTESQPQQNTRVTFAVPDQRQKQKQRVPLPCSSASSNRMKSPSRYHQTDHNSLSNEINQSSDMQDRLQHNLNAHNPEHIVKTSSGIDSSTVKKGRPIKKQKSKGKLMLGEGSFGTGINHRSAQGNSVMMAQQPSNEYSQGSGSADINSSPNPTTIRTSSNEQSVGACPNYYTQPQPQASSSSSSAQSSMGNCTAAKSGKPLVGGYFGQIFNNSNSNQN